MIKVKRMEKIYLPVGKSKSGQYNIMHIRCMLDGQSEKPELE